MAYLNGNNMSKQNADHLRSVINALNSEGLAAEFHLIDWALKHQVTMAAINAYMTRNNFPTDHLMWQKIQADEAGVLAALQPAQEASHA